MNQEVSQLIENSEKWKAEITLLRSLVLDCGLEEEYKWKQPCYSYKGKNILILAQFKNYCAISFVKGVFLKDEHKLLEAPGENSRTVRMMKFTDLNTISQIKQEIKAYIFEAVEVEKAGLKVEKAKPEDQDVPEELLEKFASNTNFKEAFYGLTPGRQRAYLMFFSQGKQAQTRINRINKFEGRILKGYGMNDCVCGLSKRMPNCDGSHKELA